MHEILRNLRTGARVLDLGSLTGSFPMDCCPGAFVVRLDLEAPAPGSVDGFVQADAARLPFPDGAFDAVIANHSLEHIQQFQYCACRDWTRRSPGWQSLHRRARRVDVLRPALSLDLPRRESHKSLSFRRRTIVGRYAGHRPPPQRRQGTLLLVRISQSLLLSIAHALASLVCGQRQPAMHRWPQLCGPVVRSALRYARKRLRLGALLRQYRRRNHTRTLEQCMRGLRSRQLCRLAPREQAGAQALPHLPLVPLPRLRLVEFLHARRLICTADPWSAAGPRPAFGRMADEGPLRVNSGRGPGGSAHDTGQSV